MQYWREFSPSIYLTRERKREGMRPNYIWYRTSHCCHQKSEECRRMCSKTWWINIKFSIRGWYPQSDMYTLSLLFSLSLSLLLLDSLASLLFKEWTSVLHAAELHPTLNMWCYLVQCTSGGSNVFCGLWTHAWTHKLTDSCMLQNSNV